MSRVLMAAEVPVSTVVFSLASFEQEAGDIVAAARQQAAEILRLAREEADAIQANARRAGLDAGHAAGLASGRAEGLRAGREEGLAACRAETATLAEGLLSLVQQLRDRREALVKEAERDLLALSVRVAERIVRREIDVDARVAVRAVAEAVSLASERSRVKLVLNPADLDAVKSAHHDLSTHLALISDLQLEEDAAVTRGGCRVVTGAGEIDMRVETQLQRIGMLLGSSRGTVPDADDRTGQS